jgi:hypothetical protein
MFIFPLPFCPPLYAILKQSEEAERLKANKEFFYRKKKLHTHYSKIKQ